MHIKDMRQPVIEEASPLYFKPNVIVLKLFCRYIDSREPYTDEIFNDFVEEMALDKYYPKEDRMHFMQLVGLTVKQYEEMCKKIDAND